MRPFGKRSALTITKVGHCLVVHPRKADPAALREEVARLAEEPGRTIVVLDLEPGADLADPSDLEVLLEPLGAAAGTPRLVPGWLGAGDTLQTAEQLARALGRTVIGHGGRPHPTVGGGLFVAPHEGPGWIAFDADGARGERSSRFPTPDWECDALCRPGALGPYTVEPIPAGIWIRPVAAASAADLYRRRLHENLAVDPRVPRIVVGCPGTPICPPAAVADFWRSLPEPVRARVRFAGLGARRPGPGFGQELAEAVGAPVIVGSGVRLAASAPGVGESHTVLPEGPMLWTPYVADLRYTPAHVTRDRVPGGVAAGAGAGTGTGTGTGTGASSAVGAGPGAGPGPVDARPPIADLAQKSPGVFELDRATVLEVIQSGLYLRPRVEPDTARAVRLLPPEPDFARFVFDDADAGERQRMRELAAATIGRLEPGSRKAFRVIPASTAAATTAAAAAATAAGTAPTAIVSPAAPRPRHAVVSERAQLRGRLGPRFDTVATQLSTMLRHGGLLPGTADPAHDDVLAEFVAARLLLTGHPMGPEGDRRGAVTRTPGSGSPAVPAAAAAGWAVRGLSRLPVFHGPVFAHADLDEERWRVYEGGGSVVEPALRHAVTQQPRKGGRVRLVIWSVSARQAAELLPETPDVVVFLPGTRFEILAADRRRDRVLLREDAGPGVEAWPWTRPEAMAALLETADRERGGAVGGESGLRACPS